MGWDSIVSVVTHYRLDGPGIESQWGAKLPTTVQCDPAAHPASYTMDIGSYPGVKRPWGGVNHPPPTRIKVKERVQPYLYSPSVSSWQVIG